MLEKTIYSQGKNQYKDNTFCSQEWSAPIMVSPTEIEERISEMKLVGRTLSAVRIMGLSFWHTEDWIEDAAYNELPADMPEEERQEKSNYANVSDDLEFARFAHIDEPFLIKFTDGDVFEIDTPQTPEYRFSLNCVPWNIHTNTRINNVDAMILFAPALNQKIVEVEITKEVIDKDPILRCDFDEQGSTREIVTRIVLWLENDIGICVSGWIDYCDVACIDRSNEALPILFGELKTALNN